MFKLSVAASRIWWQRIGAVGAALALAILGASMLLRLTTEFTADAHTLSVLPPAVEQATRMLHRLSASAVALLALVAMLLCWAQRKAGAGMAGPTAWIVAATVLLAGIGPLTPGYRVAAITVLNVSVGMLLLMAFWWLRESAASGNVPRTKMDALSRWTLVVFIAHIATGAGASAYQMLGLHWPARVHLGSAVLCVYLLVALLIEKRLSSSRAHSGKALVYLMFTQLLLGAALIWLNHRPLWLSFMHAMLSPLLAMALVSLVRRHRN